MKDDAQGWWLGGRSMWCNCTNGSWDGMIIVDETYWPVPIKIYQNTDELWTTWMDWTTWEECLLRFRTTSLLPLNCWRLLHQTLHPWGIGEFLVSEEGNSWHEGPEYNNIPGLYSSSQEVLYYRRGFLGERFLPRWGGGRGWCGSRLFCPLLHPEQDSVESSYSLPSLYIPRFSFPILPTRATARDMDLFVSNKTRQLPNLRKFSCRPPRKYGDTCGIQKVDCMSRSDPWHEEGGLSRGTITRVSRDWCAYIWLSRWT